MVETNANRYDGSLLSSNGQATASTAVVHGEFVYEHGEPIYTPCEGATEQARKILVHFYYFYTAHTPVPQLAIFMNSFCDWLYAIVSVRYVRQDYEYSYGIATVSFS